ncbi:MAG: DUF58 domain-containing protein [Oscillospiraceae bacterium]|nr:DUF58 domain-containing protein [Oscillospiraceae bacterium]
MKRARLVVSPGRAALLAAAAVLCAVPAAVLNTLPGYLPILFLLFLCALSLAYAVIVSRGLRCEGLGGEESCFRGDSVPVSMRVVNASKLVCVGVRAECFTTDAFGGVRSSESLRFTLAPGESRDFGFDVSLDHVGRYTVGLRSLRTSALLGVVSVERMSSFMKTVTVLPRCHDLGRLAVSETVRTESVYANRVSTADSVDYSGVREYSIGDPIKLIHWNLSSHTGNYMTKLLESYGNNSMTVIPCTVTPDYDAETAMEAFDGVSECCASLGMFARNQGMDAELLYEDASGEAVRSPLAGTEELMAILPGPENESGCEMLERMLELECTRRYSASNLAVCTSVLSEYAAKQIMELQRRMKSVILFYVRPYGAPEQSAADRAVRTLRAADIQMYVIPSADEIGRSAVL